MKKNITFVALLSVAVLFSSCGQSQQHPQDFASDTVLPAHRLTDSLGDAKAEGDNQQTLKRLEKELNHREPVFQQ